MLQDSDTPSSYQPPTLLGQCGRAAPSDAELESLCARGDWHGLIEAMSYWLGVWAEDVIRVRGMKRTDDRLQELVAEGALVLTEAFSGNAPLRLRGAGHVRNYARKAVKRALQTCLSSQQVVGPRATTIKKRRAKLREGKLQRPASDGRHASADAATRNWDGYMPWERGQRLELHDVQPAIEDGSAFWEVVDTLVAAALDLADAPTRAAAELILQSPGGASVEFAARHVGVNRRTLADRLNRLARAIPRAVSEEIDVRTAEYLGNRWEKSCHRSADSGKGSQGKRWTHREVSRG